MGRSVWRSDWRKQLLWLVGQHNTSSMFVMFYYCLDFLKFEWTRSCSTCLATGGILAPNDTMIVCGFSKSSQKHLKLWRCWYKKKRISILDKLHVLEIASQKRETQRRRGRAARCGQAELLFPSASRGMIEIADCKGCASAEAMSSSSVHTEVPRRVPSSVKCTGDACCFMSNSQRRSTSSLWPHRCSGLMEMLTAT